MDKVKSHDSGTRVRSAVLVRSKDLAAFRTYDRLTGSLRLSAGDVQSGSRERQNKGVGRSGKGV